MIRVYWKAAEYNSLGQLKPLDMDWSSYATADIKALQDGAPALIRLPPDPTGPTCPAPLPKVIIP